MIDILAFTIIKILPVILTLTYMINLLYVRQHPERRKTPMSKYKKGTPAYGLRAGLYSDRFLKGWACITLLFASDLAFTIYKFHNQPPAFLSFFMLLSFFVLLFTGLTLINSAIKKGVGKLR